MHIYFTQHSYLDHSHIYTYRPPSSLLEKLVSHNQEGESQARTEEEGEGNRQPKSVLDLEGQVLKGKK